MNYPTKGALYRAGRTVAALVLGALTAALVNQTPVALEGTTFSVFAGFITTAILAADKLIRAQLDLKTPPQPEV